MSAKPEEEESASSPMLSLSAALLAEPLDFALDGNLESLSTAQLCLVQFHPEADEATRNRAELIYWRRRNRAQAVAARRRRESQTPTATGSDTARAANENDEGEQKPAQTAAAKRKRDEEETQNKKPKNDDGEGEDGFTAPRAPASGSTAAASTSGTSEQTAAASELEAQRRAGPQMPANPTATADARLPAEAAAAKSQAGPLPIKKKDGNSGNGRPPPPDAGAGRVAIAPAAQPPQETEPRLNARLDALKARLVADAERRGQRDAQQQQQQTASPSVAPAPATPAAVRAGAPAAAGLPARPAPATTNANAPNAARNAAPPVPMAPYNIRPDQLTAEQMSYIRNMYNDIRIPYPQDPAYAAAAFNALTTHSPNPIDNFARERVELSRLYQTHRVHEPNQQQWFRMAPYAIAMSPTPMIAESNGTLYLNPIRFTRYSMRYSDLQAQAAVRQQDPRYQAAMAAARAGPQPTAAAVPTAANARPAISATATSPTTSVPPTRQAQAPAADAPSTKRPRSRSTGNSDESARETAGGAEANKSKKLKPSPMPSGDTVPPIIDRQGPASTADYGADAIFGVRARTDDTSPTYVRFGKQARADRLLQLQAALGNPDSLEALLDRLTMLGPEDKASLPDYNFWCKAILRILAYGSRGSREADRTAAFAAGLQELEAVERPGTPQERKLNKLQEELSTLAGAEDDAEAEAEMQRRRERSLAPSVSSVAAERNRGPPSVRFREQNSVIPPDAEAKKEEESSNAETGKDDVKQEVKAEPAPSTGASSAAPITEATEENRATPPANSAPNAVPTGPRAAATPAAVSTPAGSPAQSAQGTPVAAGTTEPRVKIPSDMINDLVCVFVNQIPLFTTQEEFTAWIRDLGDPRPVVIAPLAKTVDNTSMYTRVYFWTTDDANAFIAAMKRNPERRLAMIIMKQKQKRPNVTWHDCFDDEGIQKLVHIGKKLGKPDLPQKSPLTGAYTGALGSYRRPYGAAASTSASSRPAQATLAGPRNGTTSTTSSTSSASSLAARLGDVGASPPGQPSVARQRASATSTTGSGSSGSLDAGQGQSALLTRLSPADAQIEAARRARSSPARREGDDIPHRAAGEGDNDRQGDSSAELLSRLGGSK